MDFLKMVQRGVRYDKRRFADDMKVFEGKGSSTRVSKTAVATESIDFFGNEPKVSTKDQTEPEEEDNEGEEDVDDEDEGGDSSAATGMTKAASKAFRKQHKVMVRGHDVPAMLPSFDHFAKAGVPQYILDNLRKPIPEGSGYSEPTPIQMQAVSILMKGRELVACAPTGSGKTAAFLIPLLSILKSPGKAGLRGVILAPTRELSEQIFRHLTLLAQGKSWRCYHLSKANASSFSDPMQGKRKDVLVTTPMRLVNLIQTNGIDLSAVQFLVLDEADRLFEANEGDQGFDEQIDTILSACSHPKINRVMFSATMPQGIENLIATFLRDPIRITVGARNSAAVSVKQELHFVGREDAKLMAFRNLVQGGLKLPVLVFVQSKGRATQLYTELVYDNLNVDVIHSERTVAQRTDIMNKFRSGKVWVLICTDLMARGVDFKGVNTVINYDFPQSTVSYIHRIGRSGRAGRKGHAITFFTERDGPLLRSIAGVVRASGCDIPDWMLKLDKNHKLRKKLANNPIARESISTARTENKDKKDSKKKKRRRSTGATQATAGTAAQAPATQKASKPEAQGKPKTSSSAIPSPSTASDAPRKRKRVRKRKGAAE